MSVSGCDDASRVFFRADSDQRTRATAVALAAGMLPGCPADPQALAEGEEDPLFNGAVPGSPAPDRALALAAARGRVGDRPEELAELYRNHFAELHRILGKPLPAGPVTIATGRGDNLIDVTGPLRTASTLTENLLLEYTNGMSGKDLGWGRLDAVSLRDVMALHTAYADLARRTPYLARDHSGNLLAQVLASLQQAVEGKPVPGTLGPPSTKVLVLSGHDTNLSNLSGMLGLNWVLPGYAADDTPPGGALVFELWREATGWSVRTRYLAQSLEQMHDAIPLTGGTAPLQAPVFVPGCSVAGAGYPCDWNAFRRAVDAALGRLP